ncbi:hypothetical protein GCM10009557_75240 [Virgisporangium ochraceum]|uniref:Uncharacterized protein n=1 Tax=Virgisporangium ochraceum TaxID=65505 RepID=A0A8J3ZMN9_9ACTN|nr:hypothetical protein [Virgisporangium ochraceum]GIJ66599.1 hypothetical protein Voc01_015160 [Virgisporangium ochraceum]
MGADYMGVVETAGLLRQVTAGIVTSTRADPRTALAVVVPARRQRQAPEVLREAADAVGSDLSVVAAKLVSTVAARANRPR